MLPEEVKWKFENWYYCVGVMQSQHPESKWGPSISDSMSHLYLLNLVNRDGVTVSPDTMMREQINQCLPCQVIRDGVKDMT